MGKLTLVILSVSVWLIGCSTSLSNPGSASTASLATVTLTVLPEPANVQAGKSVQLQTSGGTAPYNYMVVTGTCVMDANNKGLVLAGSIAETCTISVTDSSTGSLLKSVYVSAAPTNTVTYSWVGSGWTNCNCDTGKQTQTVACKDNSGTTVSNNLCTGTQPATTQSCDQTKCVPGQWGLANQNDQTITASCADLGFTYAIQDLKGLVVTIPNSCTPIGSTCALTWTNSGVSRMINYSCQ